MQQTKIAFGAKTKVFPLLFFDFRDRCSNTLNMAMLEKYQQKQEPSLLK